MPVQIGRKESDFSNPLGLLTDCHRRIENFLDVLVRVANQAGSALLKAAEREALDKSLAYFRSSAPKHTADEEESLFPRLRSSGNGESTLACLVKLEADHQAAARDHDLVDSLGRAWLAAGILAPAQLQQMREALSRLSHMYRQHIAVEDRELFPLAASLLSPDQIADVGREMADRRSVSKK